MTATQILDDLRGRAVALTSNGDKLRIDAPVGVLTDNDRQAIRDHKAELLDLLAEENPEMHDSALFDVIVEVAFYDGRRIRIPQQSTPAGWESPF